MKKLITILGIIVIGACATQPLKPELVQNQLALGMSVADVIAALDIPDNKKEENGQLQLSYPGYVLSFTNGQLTAAQTFSEKKGLGEFPLKTVAEKRPDYKPDSLVLNKDLSLEASAYRVAGYLHDEALFEKAVAAGINVNGFTVKSNALCVALAEGFLKGAEDVIKIGYNPDLRLRTDKGTYIYPKDCLSLQKDAVAAEQLKNSLIAEEQKAVADEKAGIKKEKKSLVDWEAVGEFLKPQAPPPASNIKK